MEKIKILLKPKHFKSAKSFSSNTNCPLSEAIKDHFNTTNVNVGTGDVFINDMTETFTISNEWKYVSVNHINALIKKAKQKKKVGTYTIELIKN